jgi:hypothetical protein
MMDTMIDMFADHAKIIKYNEGNLGQAQIPVDTLYHRWNISMTFVTRYNAARLKGVNINVGVFLSVPTCTNHRSITH